MSTAFDDDDGFPTKYIENIFKLVGFLSSLASSSIIITVFFFPTMIRKKLFMSCLLWVSVTDFLGSVFISLGFATGKLCGVQGGMIFFFLRASWVSSFIFFRDHSF